jgi:hypothetical protein
MVTTRKGRVVYRGMLPDDDPIYRRAGWNFLASANLKPPPPPNEEPGPQKMTERDAGEAETT